MTKNIKVLHIISNLQQGGAERQLIELVKKNKHHAICQLASGSIFDEDIIKHNILRFNLNIKKNIFSIFSLYKLYKIIKNYEPEIITTWMYHSSFLTVILRKVILSNKIPLVWCLRCSNMETQYYSKLLKYFILGCKYFSSCPNLIVNNSIDGKKFHNSIGFKNKHVVIHNGIDVNKFTYNKSQRNKLRIKYKISEKAKVILCVGRNDPMKDHITLISAFKKLRKEFSSTILILVGSGTEEIKISDGVIALGMRTDMNLVYSLGDIIVSSSAFGEGFSNALAEGMSSGLIPISTDVGDSKIIVGEVGKIVAPRNIQDLFLAMKDLLEMDEQIFENSKLLAKQRIIEHFSIQKMASSYDNVYKNLIESDCK